MGFDRVHPLDPVSLGLNSLSSTPDQFDGEYYTEVVTPGGYKGRFGWFASVRQACIHHIPVTDIDIDAYTDSISTITCTCWRRTRMDAANSSSTKMASLPRPKTSTNSGATPTTVPSMISIKPTATPTWLVRIVALKATSARLTALWAQLVSLHPPSISMTPKESPLAHEQIKRSLPGSLKSVFEQHNTVVASVGTYRCGADGGNVWRWPLFC